MIELYPHQDQAIESLYDAIRAGCKYNILRAETGFGKTYTAAEILRRAYSKGSVAWFVVPRKELLKQTAKSFNKAGLPFTYIASGYSHKEGRNIKLVSLQSLRSRIDSIVRKPDLIMIDETDYGGGDIDKLILWAKAHSIIVVGLTATPILGNGDGLGKWYDNIVETKDMRWLIDRGFLSDYRLFAPVKPDLKGVGIRAGDYIASELDERLALDGQRVSKAAQIYKDNINGLRTVVFGTSLKDCDNICQQFNEAGINAQTISSRNTDVERGRIIKKFAEATHPVLINVDLLTFGFDLSAQVERDVTIEAIIDMAPTLSFRKQRQKNGRALRKKEKPAILYDLAGNTHMDKHGLPCQHVQWTLEAKKRRAGASGEKTMPVRQCDKCFFCHPPEPTCPNCGHEYPYNGRLIEEVEAELAEIKAEEVRQQAKDRRMQQGKARTRADLEEIAKERGYKPGWVIKQMQIKGIRE